MAPMLPEPLQLRVSMYAVGQLVDCLSPSDNDDPVLALGRALDAQTSSLGLDSLFLALDIDTPVFLLDLELGERVESRSVFDVTSSDTEACYKQPIVSIEKHTE